MFRFGKQLLTGIAAICAMMAIFSVIAAAQEIGDELGDISLGDVLEIKYLETATKRKMDLRKAPAIATVITADEIRNMGARDLMDVLKMVPGFGISINEFGRHMFEVRGIRTSTSEKILVMMDGHRLNESYTGSALAYIFGDISVDNARQIEIVRGPGSALYGANAFVAVVNIITKNPDDIDGVEIRAAGGNFDTKKLTLLGGKSFDKFKIAGSVDYLDTDGPEADIEADRLAGKPFSASPGKTDLHREKKEAFLKVAYGDLTLKGHFADKERGSYIGWARALTDENTYRHKNFWTELGYSKSFTDRIYSSMRVYYDYLEQETMLELFPEGFPGFPDGMSASPGLKNRTVGTELQFDADLFEGNHLIIGGNFEDIKQYDVGMSANYNPLNNTPLGSLQDVTSWANFNKDATRKVWAVYVQDEWKIGDNLNLTGGVRYDNYEDFGNTVNPRAGVVWNFLKDTDMKLLYGQAFRAPSFLELYNAGNPVLLGNPDLKPEKIKTYEASLGYRFKTSHSISVNYFYNDINDLITPDTSTSPGQYANRGGAVVDGVEIVLGGKYSSANYWQLTYT